MEDQDNKESLETDLSAALRSTYYAISNTDVFESLVTIKRILHISGFTARKLAGETMHRQGKKRVSGSYFGAMSEMEAYQDAAKRRTLKAEMASVVQNFVNHTCYDGNGDPIISNPTDYFVKSVIVYLQSEGLHDVLDKIKFPNINDGIYDDIVQKCFDLVAQAQGEALNGLENYFREVGKVEHADIVVQRGIDVFKTSKAIEALDQFFNQKFIFDEELMTSRSQDYKKFREFRQLYINNSKKIKLKTYQDLAGISGSHYRRKRTEFLNGLSDFITEENKTLLNAFNVI